MRKKRRLERLKLSAHCSGFIEGFRNEFISPEVAEILNLDQDRPIFSGTNIKRSVCSTSDLIGPNSDWNGPDPN